MRCFDPSSPRAPGLAHAVAWATPTDAVIVQLHPSATPATVDALCADLEAGGGRCERVYGAVFRGAAARVAPIRAGCV